MISVGNLLVQKGVKVEIYALGFLPISGPRVSINDLLKIIKFDYHEVAYKRGRFNPLRMEAIPKIDTDVTYVTGGYYYFLKQCFKSNSPTIYGFHEPALQKPNSRLQKLIVNKLFPKFDLFHLLNEVQLEIIPKESKYFILSNTWFDEIPKSTDKFEKFTILFLGRHEVSKGIDTLEYVINNAENDIELYIAGSGSVNLNVPKDKSNVHVLGFVEEKILGEYLSKSHAVLFPSYSEASSIVAVEALAHSTPLVYRGLPQNALLDNIEMCLKADNDINFLKAVNELKKQYSLNPSEYLKKCSLLPGFLMPSETYIETFIAKAASLIK